MKYWCLTILPALGALALLFARFHPFASGLPMVGTVQLGNTTHGGSALSWAGDGRLVCGFVILLLAAIATALRSSKWMNWLAGLALGWLGAFAYGAVQWYTQQMEMFQAMQIDPEKLEFSLGTGFFALVVAFALTFVFGFWAVISLPSRRNIANISAD